MAASERVMAVTDSTFEAEVLKSELPVLIDFWAPRCGPCMSLGPVIDQLAGEYSGRAKVVKINADENPNTMARCGVRAIPNLLVLRGGQIRQQIIGAVAKSKISRALDEALA
jgi:thioredoxin 1